MNNCFEILDDTRLIKNEKNACFCITFDLILTLIFLNFSANIRCKAFIVMYSLLNLIFCIDVCDELNENIKNKVIAARDNFDVNLNVVENVIDDVINV